MMVVVVVVVVKNKKNALVKTINKINHSTHTLTAAAAFQKICVCRSENDDICSSGPYKYPTCFFSAI